MGATQDLPQKLTFKLADISQLHLVDETTGSRMATDVCLSWPKVLNLVLS